MAKSKGKGKGKGRSWGKTIAQRTASLRQVANDMVDAGIHVTQTVRSAASRLGRRNPSSLHLQALAFDTRAKTPEQADAVMAAQRAVFDAKGLVYGRDYSFIDEVRNPSLHATAKHIHTQFTPAGLARYRASAAATLPGVRLASVPEAATPPDLGFTPRSTTASQRSSLAPATAPTPTPRPDPIGRVAEVAAAGLLGPSSSGLQPGMVGGSMAPNFAPPGPASVGGLLGRPSANLGLMPPSAGSGLPAPSAPDPSRFASPTVYSPAPGTGKTSRLGASPEPSDPSRFGGPVQPSPIDITNVPAETERSFTPNLSKQGIGVDTPALRGEVTATAKPTLPDMGPALAMRPGGLLATGSGLPDTAPTPGVRPVDSLAEAEQAGAKVAIDNGLGPAQATDETMMASYDEEPASKPSYAQRALDKAFGTPTTDEDRAKPATITPGPSKLGGPFPEAPDEPGGILGGLFSPATKAFGRLGLRVGGLPGMALGGLLGRTINKYSKPGFDAGMPMSERTSVGSGLSGVNAALSGPRGATATSLSNPGMSVTSLGNGKSLRRSDRYGWTEVVGPDGSVLGIQYDKPEKKGIFGYMSNRVGGLMGSGRGASISPAAQGAIDRGEGGLY